MALLFVEIVNSFVNCRILLLSEAWALDRPDAKEFSGAKAGFKLHKTILKNHCEGDAVYQDSVYVARPLIISMLTCLSIIK